MIWVDCRGSRPFGVRVSGYNSNMQDWDTKCYRVVLCVSSSLQKKDLLTNGRQARTLFFSLFSRVASSVQNKPTICWELDWGHIAAQAEHLAEKAVRKENSGEESAALKKPAFGDTYITRGEPEVQGCGGRTKWPQQCTMFLYISI